MLHAALCCAAIDACHGALIAARVRKPSNTCYALQVLEDHLPRLLQQVQLDIVLYNAGVDVHKDDALGKFALTNDGIWRRDCIVMQQCALHRVSLLLCLGRAGCLLHGMLVTALCWSEVNLLKS